MFTRLAPQKVKHSDGFVVQIANRHSAEYIESSRRATISVEFGAWVCVYENTLSAWSSDAGGSSMSATDRERVARRIVAGLEAMGGRPVKLC